MGFFISLRCDPELGGSIVRLAGRQAGGGRRAARPAACRTEQVSVARPVSEVPLVATTVTLANLTLEQSLTAHVNLPVAANH